MHGSPARRGAAFVRNLRGATPYQAYARVELQQLDHHISHAARVEIRECADWHVEAIDDRVSRLGHMSALGFNVVDLEAQVIDALADGFDEIHRDPAAFDGLHDLEHETALADERDHAVHGIVGKFRRRHIGLSHDLETKRFVERARGLRIANDQSRVVESPPVPMQH
jgi:hypothetical protein